MSDLITHPADGHANGASAPERSMAPRRPGTLKRAWDLTRKWRWILGLVALLLAWWAEQMAEEARAQAMPAPPALSWWLFALAGLTFALAAWPVPRVAPSRPMPFLRAIRENRRRFFFLLPLVLSVVCFLLATPMFLSLNSNFGPDATDPGFLANTASWILYIWSLLLFGLAFVVWERTAPAGYGGRETPQPGDRLPRRVEWAVIAGLFVVGLALRLANLDSLPHGLWFDEAQNGLVAQQLVAPGAIHATFVADKTQLGALFFYVLGSLFNFTGNLVWPLRFLPAAGGALIVPMLYLLGARLYGWRVGLAAAGLLAVSSWNITFSRLGMVSMFTVALDVAIFLCTAQALRTGRLGYWAGAGVLLGLSLQMYYVSRLVPAVLAIVLVHKLITERMRLLRALWPGVGVLVLGLLLAFLPMGTFALQHWDIYNGRVNEVSIFGAGGGGAPDAFSQSLTKHLLMFNFAGDANGRHNLPGQPMLDWLSAMLFFAGLAAAAFRAWRWQYFFPIVWWAAALSGGVLSLLFEAPQSHRTLENSVVVALLGGIFLGELWQMISRAFAPVAEPVQAEPDEPSVFQRLRARRAGPRAVGPVPVHAAVAGAALPVRSAVPVRRRQEAGPAAGHAATSLPVRAHAAVAEAEPVHPEEAAPAATAPATAVDLSQPDLAKRTHHLRAAARAEKQNAAALTRRQIAAMLVSGLTIVAVVAWVGSISLVRYFQTQANDRGVWKDMYSSEAEAARVLARYGSTRDVYITPIYEGLPPSQYLAPNLQPLDWHGLYELPFSPAGSKDVVIVLDPPSAADLAYIARMYPNAKFDPLRAPSDTTPLMWTITIPASDIRELQGVQAAIFDKGTSRVVSEKTVASMDFDWRSEALTSGAVRLSATLRADKFASYTFTMQSAGSGQPGPISVDGYPVTSQAPISLAAGLHSVVLTDTVSSLAGNGHTQLLWSYAPDVPAAQQVPPNNLFNPARVEPHGLTAVFRKGQTFDAPVADSRIDPVVSAYFHKTPLDRPYTAAWTGKLYIPLQGQYTFGTEQLSRSRLLIDNNLVVSNTSANNLLENNLTLPPGWHDIRVEFEDLDNYSHMYLYWTPPGHLRSIIPSAFLWPVLGQYPEPGGSEAFPTLDQADGTNLPADRIVGGVVGPPVQQGSTPVPSVPQQAAQPPQLKGDPIKPDFVLGESGEPLPGPWTAAADAQGNISIYSYKDGQVHQFDAAGKPVRAWPVRNDKGTAYAEISAMVISGTQTLLLDAQSGNVLAYGQGGSFISSTHLCDCYFPRSFSRSRDGNFWVGDTGNARVLKVDAGGQVLATVGERGSGPGQFVEPTSVFETATGVLYVVDTGNSRVQSFDPSLKPLAQWPMGATVARDGNRLAVDSSGNALVTESENNIVVQYDQAGKELHRWAYAVGPDVAVPVGITWLGDRVLVLFPQSDRAVVFKP